MIFWFLLALMATGMTAAMVLPLLRPERGRASDPSTGFTAQLAELERDRELGLIAETEARAVEIEIKRRLLAAQAETRPEGAPSQALRQAAIAVIGAAAIASVGVYVFTGRPDLIGAPEAPQSQASAMPGTPQEMVASLARRLEAEPDDFDGWAMLGQSLLTLEQPAEAADAFERALALDDSYAALWASLGQARVFAAGGEITPQARNAFTEALERDPGEVRARFFLAEAAYQDGDRDQALAMLRAQLAELGEDTPRGALIARRIDMIEMDADGGTE